MRFIVPIIALLVIAVPALASPMDDAADAPVPAPLAPAHDDRFELSPWRVDGGAGVSGSERGLALALRAHLGRSWWWIGSHDGNDWQLGVRVSTGVALGADLHEPQADVSAAPFLEVGLAMADPRERYRHGARDVTVFGRAEPLFGGGLLREPGARLGVGVTLHGFGLAGLGPGLCQNSRDSDDGCELARALATVVALPVLVALNFRDVEVSTDLGIDGRRAYAVTVGLGI